MRLQFWGAAQTVTGSMHLLEVGGRQLLLDGGLYQGRRKHAFEVNRQLPFAAAAIDAVVLSHAHIDHSGNLPSLVKAGFRGRIYATSATRDLAALMLLDSAHIQENDVAYVNRQRKAEGRRLFEPLYIRADAIRTLELFTSVEYKQPFEPIPGVTAHFRDAGHMLGSGIVVLDLAEKGRSCRLVFSGDIGRHGMPILRDPQTVADADAVIMESTYGDRQHEPENEARDLLKQCAQHAFDHRGKILIPAFAVGRTQEIVYRLNQLWEARELPPIHVYVDSPLAINATEVYMLHPECFDAEMHDARMRETDGDPLRFPRLRFVRAAEDSKKLNGLDEPAIIISASGMCESGRILHHLKNHIEDRHTTVLFVGFQAEHTLGRKLLDGVNPVSIFGKPYHVRARIRRIDGYSAHADRDGLLAWAKTVQETGPVKQIFLVHGEKPAAEALRAGLLAQGAGEVHIPSRGQAFPL